MSTSNTEIVPEEMTEDNYEYWKRCLKSYLVGNGLWGVVSGMEPKPADKMTGKYEEWRRKNALALHAIQLSCGSSIYSKFKGTHVNASHAWEYLAEKCKTVKVQLSTTLLYLDDESMTEENGITEHIEYDHLYKAVKNGKWEEVKRQINGNPTALRARISSHADTALHVAILNGHHRIAEELVKLMDSHDLALINEFGATPLSLAAIGSDTKLVRSMVKKNSQLVSIANDHDDDTLPAIVAANYGRRRMVRYLYSMTPKEILSPDRGNFGATLLNSLITSDIYDIASRLLKRYPHLGVVQDLYGNYALRILAQKPSVFPSSSKFVFWQRWIYNCVRVHSPLDGRHHHSHGGHHLEEIYRPKFNERHIEVHESSDEELDQSTQHRGLIGGGTLASRVKRLFWQLSWDLLRCLVPDIKHIYDRKVVHEEAVQLLKCIFQEIRTVKKSQLEKMEIDKAIYDAIKHGIIEFIQEIINYNPEIIWHKDKNGRTIFSHAIVLRQEKIYRLIHDLGTQKSIIANQHDIFGNNFLHLAAKLSPPVQLERVSGAALQMQRELQWFKEVESMLQPKYKEEVNDNNKTPETLFNHEHKELVKEGERWMKNTAGTSMIVGTLVAAVMFTTTFTVPGGNESSTGIPIMLDKKASRNLFLIFMDFSSFSIFTSSTSVLMFLGILTARYTEEDFLRSLPTKLILGLAFLFFSIASMMISFRSSLYLIMHEQLRWATIPIIVFSTIPVALFSILQFPLLIEIVMRTYGPGIFSRPKKHPR